MSRLRLAVCAIAIAGLAVALATSAGAEDAGARALFFGPPGSTANPAGAVGFHFWFERASEPPRGGQPGKRFTTAREAGERVRLHVVSNTGGFLSAWLTAGSADGEGVRLTPLDGRFAGYGISGHREQVLPVEIPVPDRDTRSIVILFARSQTEQAYTVEHARERLTHNVARDGRPAIVQETVTQLPNEVGTYVVHREGAQPMIEVDLRR